MKALTLRRVAEETAGKKNLTAKYDGTTDSRGRYVTEVEVATENETFLVGLCTQSLPTQRSFFFVIFASQNVPFFENCCRIACLPNS